MEGTTRSTLAPRRKPGMSRGREGRSLIGEDCENLVEPRDAEDVAHIFAQSAEGEFSTVCGNSLHGFDENGEPGAINITDPGKIDYDA